MLCFPLLVPSAMITYLSGGQISDNLIMILEVSQRDHSDLRPLPQSCAGQPYTLLFRLLLRILDF